MGFDQRGEVILSLSRSSDNKWEVREKGMDKALAAFDEERDARKYADDLAKTRPGVRVEH